MTLNTDDKILISKFVSDSSHIVIDAIAENVNGALHKITEHLNEQNRYFSNRFDDVEKRLEDIENSFDMVKKDTGLIPGILGILEVDGVDIGELKIKIKELNNFRYKA